MTGARPLCPYCGSVARLVSADQVYGAQTVRDRGLGGKQFWRCAPCDAHVGCHPGTSKPLGRLANKALRSLKSKAHAAFDPLWALKAKRDRCSKGVARRAAYAWLAKSMGLPGSKTHIGMFDEDQCRQVLALVAGLVKKPGDAA